MNQTIISDPGDEVEPIYENILVLIRNGIMLIGHMDVNKASHIALALAMAQNTGLKIAMVKDIDAATEDINKAASSMNGLAEQMQKASDSMKLTSLYLEELKTPVYFDFRKAERKRLKEQQKLARRNYKR